MCDVWGGGWGDITTHEIQSSKSTGLFNKMAMMALDCLPDPYCTNEMVGNIRWSGGFEQFW